MTKCWTNSACQERPKVNVLMSASRMITRTRRTGMRLWPVGLKCLPGGQNNNNATKCWCFDRIECQFWRETEADNKGKDCHPNFELAEDFLTCVRNINNIMKSSCFYEELAIVIVPLFNYINIYIHYTDRLTEGQTDCHTSLYPCPCLNDGQIKLHKKALSLVRDCYSCGFHFFHSHYYITKLASLLYNNRIIEIGFWLRQKKEAANVQIWRAAWQIQNLLTYISKHRFPGDKARKSLAKFHFIAADGR